MRTIVYVTCCIYRGQLDISQKNQRSEGGVLRKVSSGFVSLNLC